jgi:hypothetical protein
LNEYFGINGDNSYQGTPRAEAATPERDLGDLGDGELLTCDDHRHAQQNAPFSVDDQRKLIGQPTEVVRAE